MHKVGRPAGLIRWDTLANQQAKESGGGASWRPVRPRTVLYALLLAVAAVAMLVAFVMRTDTRAHRAARPQPELRAAVQR